MAASDTWCWDHVETIQSDTDEARRVVDAFLERVRGAGWQEHDVFGIHLAIEEAMMNAIKHGNRLDREKRVWLATVVGAEQIVIEVTDEGAGFDPSEVPDPTDDENLELPSGRGLLLMRSFMTTVLHLDRGNRVQMVKQAGVGGDDDDEEDEE